jgi:membrane-bound lytic murein transglycosylase B
MPPPPPRRARQGLPKFLVIGLLLGVMAAAVFVVKGALFEPGPPKPAPFSVPDLAVEPRAGAPFAAPPADPAALSQLAARIDVPERMMRAYTTAELKVRSSNPRCGISWTMLAGIGRLESRHARHGGAALGENGTLNPPIIGIPLDGSPGVKAIKDTDHGVLDGDPTWDRAIGPMQFLPSTWTRWATRAAGDGVKPDPQNVDDAALSAARYLCSVGGDLTSAQGWWQAVLTYNNSARYGRDVYSGQDAYARSVGTR